MSYVILITALETVGLLRDIILVAVLLLLGFALLLGAMLAVLLYRRVVPVLKKAESALDQVEAMSRRVSEDVLSPFAGLREMAFGIKPLLSFLFGGKRDERHK